MPSRAERLRERQQKRKRGNKERIDIKLEPDDTRRRTWRWQRKKGEWTRVGFYRWNPEEDADTAELRILSELSALPGFEITARHGEETPVTLDDGLLELL